MQKEHDYVLRVEFRVSWVLFLVMI